MARSSASGWVGTSIAPARATPAFYVAPSRSTPEVFRASSRQASVPTNPVIPAAVSPATPPSPTATPVTPNAFATVPQQLSDPTLGSRPVSSVNPTRPHGTESLSMSVYGTPNVPGFLTQAVSNLNAEQSLQRALRQEWQNRLVQLASTPGENQFLWQEALRAASVQPGANVTFASPVFDPSLSQSYQTAVETYTEESKARAEAANQPNTLLQRQQQLEAEKARLGANPFGQYTGSRQSEIDTELQNIYQQQQNTMARPRSVSAGAGWVPAFPRF